MHKILVLYHPPKDPAQFRTYYSETHLPLAAMGAAMGSPEGKAVAADTANYASGGYTLLHYKVE